MPGQIYSTILSHLRSESWRDERTGKKRLVFTGFLCWFFSIKTSCLRRIEMADWLRYCEWRLFCQHCCGDCSCGTAKQITSYTSQCVSADMTTAVCTVHLSQSQRCFTSVPVHLFILVLCCLCEWGFIQ